MITTEQGGCLQKTTHGGDYLLLAESDLQGTDIVVRQRVVEQGGVVRTDGEVGAVLR